MEPPESY
jgi:hypothetical protein